MMTDTEQKRIFSKNLRYYVANSGKQQKEICKDLGVNATTFSMWCTGNAVPRMDKLQKLADYFKITKSLLLDEHKLGNNAVMIHEVIDTMDDDQLARLLSYANYLMQYSEKETQV